MATDTARKRAGASNPYNPQEVREIRNKGTYLQACGAGVEGAGPAPGFTLHQALALASAAGQHFREVRGVPAHTIQARSMIKDTSHTHTHTPQDRMAAWTTY